MKNLTLALLTLSFTSLAFAEVHTFKCVATFNADKVLESEVQLDSARTSALSFGEVEEFEFFLNHTKEQAVELQVLNVLAQSRSYATATLSGAGAFVELSSWSRDLLLEVRCTQINK